MQDTGEPAVIRTSSLTLAAVVLLLLATGCGTEAPPGPVQQTATASPPMPAPTAPSAMPAPAATPTPDAGLPAVMAPATAVQQAVRDAQAGFRGNRLVGEPMEIRGRPMTYEEYHRLAEGRAYQQANDGQPARDQLVWVIALRGQMEAYRSVPACVAGAPPATYRQMILMLDAATGASAGFHMYTADHERDVSSLPVLARPTGPGPPPAPTATPGPAPSPAPTRPMARAAPPSPPGTTLPAVTTPRAAGGRIPLPPGVSRPDGPNVEVVLYSTFAAPLISQPEAMQLVADLGMPWAFGGQHDGATVTIAAWYGCATFAKLGNPSQPWAQARTIRLNDGQVLGRIENRAMWLLDYARTSDGGGSPAQPAAATTHTVYVIDAATRTVALTWSYDASCPMREVGAGACRPDSMTE